MRIHSIAVLLCALAAQGAVVLDRIAVTIGKDVVTETEVEQEIRVTAFVNGDPLNLSPEERRKAAERLVDQNLIRRDMQLSKWPQPESSEAGKLLAELKRQRYPTDAEYRAALSRYGITEAELMQHLLWQLAALRYTDYRFRPNIPPPGPALHQKLEQAAEQRSAQNAQQTESAAKTERHQGAPQPRTDETGAEPVRNHTLDPAVARGDIDQQMDAWLKDARTRTRVVYHEDAFR